MFMVCWVMPNHTDAELCRIVEASDSIRWTEILYSYQSYLDSTTESESIVPFDMIFGIFDTRREIFDARREIFDERENEIS